MNVCYLICLFFNHSFHFNNADRPRSYLDSVDRENGVIEVITDGVNEPSSSDDNDNRFDDDKNELVAFKKSSSKGRYTFVAEDDTDAAALKYLMSGRCSATLESSIMNLEEVACRIRWLKGLLKFGIQWSDLMIPSWKFLETHKVHLRSDILKILFRMDGV